MTQKEINIIKGDILLLFLGLAKRDLITRKCASVISDVACTLLDKAIERQSDYKERMNKHKANSEALA